MSEKSMLIIKSIWNDKETFKLIPISETCPYVECLFDPESDVFVVISKIKKTSLHMLPKLDDNGDPQRLKAPTATGRGIKEERRVIETFQEYYVEDVESIKSIINFVAINDDFDYLKYLNSQSV
jgi:hypothetical protein